MYTFEITFQTRDAYLGDLTCSFRTTTDAVKLHRETLALREAEGTIHSVVVRALGEQRNSQREAAA